MENIIAVIPAWVMLTIGMVLLGLELMVGSFVVIFIGAAFIFVGVLGFFMSWPSGEIQILVTVVLSAVLTLSLRKTLMKGMSQKDLPLETMQTGDLGEIVDHGGELRVMYKGTTWAFRNQGDNELNAGDEVTVEDLKNNVAYVVKSN